MVTDEVVSEVPDSSSLSESVAGVEVVIVLGNGIREDSSWPVAMVLLFIGSVEVNMSLHETCRA